MVFASEQRKPAGSGKSNIMKKSRKELQTIRQHMQRVNNKATGTVGNLGSQPSKYCSKDSNVKESLDALIQDSSPLDKHIEVLRPTQFKAMVELVHKENANGNKHDACPLRSKDRSNPNHKHVSGAIKDSVNKMDHTSGKELSSRMFGMEISNNPRDTISSMDDKFGTFNSGDLRNTISSMDDKKEMNSMLGSAGKVDNCNGKINNGKRSRESISDGNPKTNVVEEDDKQRCREMKAKRRKVIFEEDDDEANSFGDKNLMEVKDDTSKQISKDVVDYNAKVHIEHQSYCCSRPIDEPTWRGIFKVGQKYVSLAGHLSTKYCEKVWKLSRSLMSVVEVTKISRSKAWPKGWEVSKPTGDNIVLYFLPHEMRPNEELDQLVKEIMENDLVLRAIIGEAEMLIFPSILLPEQYKTFKAKHYLWGVFKPRKHEGPVVVEPLNTIGCRAYEAEKETQHVSIHQDKVRFRKQDRLTMVMRNEETIATNSATPLENNDLPSNVIMHELQATSMQGKPNMDFEPKSPKGRQEDALHQHMCTGINMDNPIDSATCANHGGIDPSRELPSGSVFGFVVRQLRESCNLFERWNAKAAW